MRLFHRGTFVVVRQGSRGGTAGLTYAFYGGGFGVELAVGGHCEWEC